MSRSNLGQPDLIDGSGKGASGQQDGQRDRREVGVWSGLRPHGEKQQHQFHAARRSGKTGKTLIWTRTKNKNRTFENDVVFFRLHCPNCFSWGIRVAFQKRRSAATVFNPGESNQSLTLVEFLQHFSRTKCLRVLQCEHAPAGRTRGMALVYVTGRTRHALRPSP